MEAQLEKALKACDKAKNYATLCATFDAQVQPLLEQTLQRPLVKEPRDHTTPDECSPTVVALRNALLTGFGTGHPVEDDVWFFLYRCASILVERRLRKRAREGETAEAARATAGGRLSSLVTNVFVLFSHRGVPQLDRMTLRWAMLKKERATVEAGDAYVHSNASERRKMQMSSTSVLSVFAERAHRHVFTSVWMLCVENAGEAALHVHLLHKLGSLVLPHLTNPLVVADYLMGCFSSGGIVSILALQGLLVLMLDYGLEYPDYYEQLYSLLTPDAFSSRHRYELFRLLDLSMTSLRVPSYVAASVVKKIAQVSLLAPSPTLYFTLPFIRKVLQSHPNCLALIHRSSKEAVLPDDGDDNNDKDSERESHSKEVASDYSHHAASSSTEAGSSGTKATRSAKELARMETAALFDGKDPFNRQALLRASHAMNSTLWELTALERHYLPIVPLMVSAYASTAEDKAPLKYEKSYGRLFTAEVTRALDAQHLPTVAYEAPSPMASGDLLTL